jgi:predicted heme/steroid binding protein
VTRSIAIATVVSVLLGMAMIGSALYWQMNRTAGPTDLADRSFTAEELARYDGVDGHQCLVAVEGDVYLIEGFALWSMGRHTPSGGRACCGLDLSDVIDESPHGKSKLQLLKKVGALKEG